MAKLTISDAARVAGVARSTLHRAINNGRLSVDPDGHVDTAELLRAGYTLQRSTQQPQPEALQAATPRVSDAQQSRSSAAPVQMTALQQERDLLQMERDLLRRELEAAQQREQAALAREQEAREERQAAREREALLLRMVEQTQHRYDRLLEAPRPGPAPGVPPAFAPASDALAPPPPSVPAQESFPNRTAARQRILALLREHPEGLTAVEVRVLLGADRSLSDTCAGMRRDGLLRRAGRGRYVVSDGSS
jgi:hypothetical protein